MKIKSFATLTLLTASFACAAPAMADDMVNTDQSTQAVDQPAQAPQAADQSAQTTSSDDNLNNNANDNDQNTPDTATGDDDY